MSALQLNFEIVAQRNPIFLEMNTFLLIKYQTKRSNEEKKQLCNYIVLYKKTAFKFNFGPWEVPKLENMHFHAFSGWVTSIGSKAILKAVF